MDSQRRKIDYRLTRHAIDRMVERGVSMAELLSVTDDPTEVESANSPAFVRFSRYSAGRVICVTIDALTDVIVTVVAPRLSDSKSDFGWFTIGSAVGERVRALERRNLLGTYSLASKPRRRRNGSGYDAIPQRAVTTLESNN